MLILLILILVASTLARIPYMCTEIRYETEHEAEQRRNYERCTETCDDFGVMSCAECRLPYEGYGCLRRRREIEMDCGLNCDLLLPDRVAQLQCQETCNIAKSLFL